ncbi:MAG: hypothetical protein V1648_05150 [Candidatus Aenigmatarchaeota archaeon]
MTFKSHIGRVVIADYGFDFAGGKSQTIFGQIDSHGGVPSNHYIVYEASGTNMKKLRSEIDSFGRKYAKTFGQAYSPLHA